MLLRNGARTVQIPTTPAARAQTVQLDDLREAFYCAFCVILVYYSPVFDCNMVVFFRNPYWHSLTIRTTQTSQGTLVSINDL